MTTLHLPPTGVWDVEALERLPDDLRYEVREGNLVVMAAAMRPWHADVQVRVRNLLVGRGAAAYIEQGVVLADGEIRTCDVAVFTDPPVDDRAYWPAAAFALLVEVVSPGSVREDRTAKPLVYAAAGIPTYWRVEEGPSGEAVVHVHALAEDGDPRYVEERVVALQELEAEDRSRRG
jgi:Uma2 family endonuclease